MLPDHIGPEAICKLGPYKNKPTKYISISLVKLLDLQSKAKNSGALDNLIKYVIDADVSTYLKKLKYTDKDLLEVIKVNTKKEYTDQLTSQEWCKVIDNLKSLIKNKENK